MRVSDLMVWDFFLLLVVVVVILPVPIPLSLPFIYLFHWNLVNNLFDLIALRGKWKRN